MPRFRSVLITGASSGLGRALALACAEPEVVLHLTGRDAVRLDKTAALCRAQGAATRLGLLDVRDADAMATWIGDAGQLDLAIANAGTSAGTGDGAPETSAQTQSILATNLFGALNTALPAMALMRTQTAGANGVRGHVALIASVAAFVAVPGAPTYCASKAALDTWTVATAPIARREGLVLTSVCPGYIRTAMTERNRFPMPGLMDADRAAAITLRAIRTGRTRVIFPWWMGTGARLADLLPPRLFGAVMARAPGKLGES